MLVVRHRDRPGVLAHVFDQLRAAAINVQETENVIFAGAEAAVARINLDGAQRPCALRRPLIALSVQSWTSRRRSHQTAQLVAIQ